MEAYFVHMPFMMSQVFEGNHPFSDQCDDP